jgi:hypothetical protein
VGDGVNVGFKISFGNMGDWRRMWEKAGKVNFTKVNIINDEAPLFIYNMY